MMKRMRKDISSQLDVYIVLLTAVHYVMLELAKLLILIVVYISQYVRITIACVIIKYFVVINTNLT